MMKRIILFALAIVFGVIANQTFAQKKQDTQVVCFKSNMDCSNCEITLTEQLRFEKGVKNLKVDHVSNTVYIEYKDGKNTEEGFAKAIEKKGYKAEKITPEKYKEMMEHVEKEGHQHGAEVHHERK
jgi:mercuric ion binding protein